MVYQNQSVEPDVPVSWCVQAYYGKQHRRYGDCPLFCGSNTYDSLNEARLVALAFVKSAKARTRFKADHDARMAKWLKSQKPKAKRRGK